MEKNVLIKKHTHGSVVELSAKRRPYIGHVSNLKILHSKNSILRVDGGPSQARVSAALGKNAN